MECFDDLNIGQEEALEIKDALQPALRDITLRASRDRLKASEETEVKEDGKTVDQIVVEHIKNLDTEGSDFEVPLLLDIYKLSDED